MDTDGNALPARQFTPRTTEDVRLAEHTQKLRELRSEYAPMPLVPQSTPLHID